MYSFEKLEIWQLSLNLVEMIYQITKKLPEDEKFGLTSQLKRASVSVCLNIAEGRAADSDAEFRRFLGISLKSLIEIITCLKVCEKLRLLDHILVQNAYQLCDKIEAKIRKLRSKLNRKRKTQVISSERVRRNASSVERN